jgi:predicted O-methyltransferase YrrM
MHPDHPWLTRQANDILSTFLKASDIGLEFGCGRSTLWFAKHTKHLTSVEHDCGWHARVVRMTELQGLRNVDCYLIPSDARDADGADSDYVRIVDRFESNSVDYVLVDGIHRAPCALAATRVVRPGGILIIDNADRFLPHDSRSPNARTIAQGPAGPLWSSLAEQLSTWRCIWTTSGVCDTALFIKTLES